VRIDRGGGDDLAGGVDDRELHAGAQSRIKPYGHPGAGRHGEQQIAQIGGEHAHGLALGGLPKPRALIEMDFDLGAPGPADRVGKPAVGTPSTITDTESSGNALLVAIVSPVGAGLFGLERKLEHLFLLGAEQREDAMGWQRHKAK